MFSQALVRTARTATHVASRNYKVAVLGGSGGIGQPLALYLKQCRMVSELSVYDVAHAKGVAADLSHIDSQATVTGYVGKEELGDALEDCAAVVIPAGVPRKPGMTRDDLFNTNAGIVMELADAVAKHCPKAMVGIISNPVNSTVPIFAETLKKHGVYDPKRVFGITTLDVVRANTFIAEHKKEDVESVEVEVIGGHAGKTIIPLLNSFNLNPEDLSRLTERVQNGGTEVVEAKAGAGSATLSMAYAGARFMINILRALEGERGIIECAYVESTLTKAPYFASPVLLTPEGFETPSTMDNGLELSDFEKERLAEAVPELEASINKGIDFVKNNYKN